MDEKKPFNDVTDHYAKHVGLPSKVEVKKLPKPLRIFSYFVFTFITIALILFVFGIIANYIN